MGRRKKFDLRGVENPAVEMDPEGGGIFDQVSYQPKSGESPRFKINRTAYTLREFQQQFDMVPQDKPGIKQKCVTSLKKAVSCSPFDFVKKRLPITNWLFNYNFKDYLLADIIVGITIAVFTAPQCKFALLSAGKIGS